MCCSSVGRWIPTPWKSLEKCFVWLHVESSVDCRLSTVVCLVRRNSFSGAKREREAPDVVSYNNKERGEREQQKGSIDV